MATERRSRVSDGASGPAETRGQSPNPAINALEALLGHSHGQGMSRLQDAFAATTSMSEPVAAAAQAMPVSEPPPTRADPRPSPVNPSHLTSVDLGTTAATATAATTWLGQPSNVPTLGHRGRHGIPVSLSTSVSPTAPETPPSNRSFTFPGPLLGSAGVQGHREPPPERGMSLPNPASSTTRRRSSPAPRKHKCPYCATEFTRHHNLKSHLLTHSHEKPFVCATCQARFRRLHDLKRHAKLHTGERPHICRRCGRRFARGDALARHTKGQGGCAGRRASLGSFVDDDDSTADVETETGPDENMEDLSYPGEGPEQDPGPDRMDDDSPTAHGADPHFRRPPGVPTTSPSSSTAVVDGVRSAPTHAAAAFGGHPRPSHSSTYPPAASHGTGSFGIHRRLQPPKVGGGESRSNATASVAHPVSSSHASGTSVLAGSSGVPSILSHGGMTESPAPLSPAHVTTSSLRPSDSSSHIRPRSPSITHKFQQRQFGRRPSARSPPPSNSLPPPLASVPHAPSSLPSLAGLGSVDPNPTATASTRVSLGDPTSSALAPAIGSSPLARMSGLPPSSSPDSTSVQRRNGPDDGNSSRAVAPPTTENLLAYVRSLESKINQLSDELLGLRRDMASHPRPS